MWTILLIIVTVLIAIGMLPSVRRKFFNTAFGQESLMIAAVLLVMGGAYLVRLALGY
ncbi:hypothetical protein LCGC14_1936230 [marine sediment metagenome]|uniref:Uncharacterized protein n=1 Tax=marine sediment metagenome TaxID=412755 RepID=A0A0F9FM17_9ZZZZ